jgi:hypothetical protein
VRAEMVRAYVETLLERLTGNEKVVADKDGDYPVRYKDALYFVRLVGEVDPVVQVFATAVTGIPSTPALLEQLNEINSSIRFARVFWVHEQVLVEADLIGSTVDPEEMDSACRAVATITDHFGPLIAQAHGGKTAFADEKKEPAGSSEDKPVEHGTGLYM